MFQTLSLFSQDLAVLSNKIDGFVHALKHYCPDLRDEDIIKNTLNYVVYECPFDISKDEAADIVSEKLSVSKGFILELINK